MKCRKYVNARWPDPTLMAQFDGKESVATYLMALDRCFKRLCARWEAVHESPLSLQDVDFCVFHAPFNKMARKAAARLWQLDAARCCWHRSQRGEGTCMYRRKAGTHAQLSWGRGYAGSRSVCTLLTRPSHRCLTSQCVLCAVRRQRLGGPTAAPSTLAAETEITPAAARQDYVSTQRTAGGSPESFYDTKVPCHMHPTSWPTHQKAA